MIVSDFLQDVSDPEAETKTVADLLAYLKQSDPNDTLYFIFEFDENNKQETYLQLDGVGFAIDMQGRPVLVPMIYETKDTPKVTFDVKACINCFTENDKNDLVLPYIKTYSDIKNRIIQMN